MKKHNYETNLKKKRENRKDETIETNKIQNTKNLKNKQRHKIRK